MVHYHKLRTSSFGTNIRNLTVETVLKFSSWVRKFESWNYGYYSTVRVFSGEEEK